MPTMQDLHLQLEVAHAKAATEYNMGVQETTNNYVTKMLDVKDHIRGI